MVAANRERVLTPSGHGFWLVAGNGSVITNGDAPYYGGASTLPLNGPIEGGAALPAGSGYWLVAYDGGIFTYGSARFYGSMHASSEPARVLDGADQVGKGYWLAPRRQDLQFRWMRAFTDQGRDKTESADQRHRHESVR